jgi:hypothetical protein
VNTTAPAGLQLIYDLPSIRDCPARGCETVFMPDAPHEGMVTVEHRQTDRYEVDPVSRKEVLRRGFAYGQIVRIDPLYRNHIVPWQRAADTVNETIRAIHEGRLRHE